MKLNIKKSTTSKILQIFVSDSSSTTGGGLTGLVYNSASLVCYYIRLGDAGATVISLANATVGTWTSGGFKEIDSTNMPGAYELHIPNAAIASGADSVFVMLKGAANMAPLPLEIQLVDNEVKDAYDIVNNGLYGNAQLARSTTPANTIDIDTDGNVTASNVGAAGGSVNTVSESFTNTTGTVASGSYTDTISVNSTYHQLQDDGGTLDVYYQFDITSFGSPNSIDVIGRVNAANDDLTVYAYNWGGTAWEALGPYDGQVSSTDVIRSFPLFTQHVGTGANLGKVRIRFEGTGLTSANLYVDQIYVGYSVIPSSTGYEEGAVWLDTVNGTAGTVQNYNGIASRPVDTIADALSLAAAIGLKRINIVGPSSITFAASMDSYTLSGSHWTLALGSQSCEGTHIKGANVSGIYTGEPEFERCYINNITGAEADFHSCSLKGTITVNGAGTFYFDHCYSGIAGTGTPTFDFGAAVGNTNANFRFYSGGIEIENMGGAGTDNMSLEGFGQYTINANCSGGTLAVRGMFTETDNASGAVTVSGDARIDVQQVRDSQKLAPSAGAAAAGSVDIHLDDIVDDTGTSGVIVATNNDKTGYSLSTAGADAIWASTTRTLTSFGTLIVDIWAYATRTLTAGTKDSEIDTINSNVTRLLGLSYENTYQHTRVYTGGKLVSAKMDTYNSKANAQTHDGTTGIVAKYTLTFTYSGTELATMNVVRDS